MSDDYLKLSGPQRRALLDQTLMLFGWRCWLCRLPIKSGDESLDHIVPRSKGGTSNIENLRPAHKTCNSSRGNRPVGVVVHDDAVFWLDNPESNPRPVDISPPMT